MFSQYFGSYLLNKGYLTAAQLQEALDQQSSVHLKLGILALNEGFMTPAQISTTHERQRLVDKRFGEIAVDLGYLTNSQLEDLLNVQQKNHLLLGQTLLDKNYLTLDQLNNALEDYKKDHGLSNKRFAAIQQGEVDEIVQVYTDFTTSRYYQSYSDYMVLFIKNLLRLMNINSRLEHNKLTSQYSAPQLIYQEIKGPLTCCTAIGCSSTRTLAALASSYAGERYEEYNEMAQAALAEFLNLHNGIFLVNMSDRDLELELNPQQVVADATMRIKGSGFVIPIHTTYGQFDVIIGENVVVSK